MGIVLNLNEPVQFGVRPHKGASLLEVCDDYVVLDLETTGLDPRWDSIIEFGAVRIRGGEIVDQFETLVNPECKIDEFITELTGITNEMLENEPTIDMVIDDVINFIGNDIVIAHNANFDINFLYDICAKNEKDFSNDFVDTMRLSRRLFNEHRHHRLIDMVQRFNISDSTEHRAFSDVINTYKCYEHMKAHIKSNGIDVKKDFNRVDVKARDIKSTKREFDETSPLFGRCFAFTGTLEKMVRRDAMQMVVDAGGMIGDGVTKETNYLVLGNNDYCKSIKDGKSSKHKKAEQLKLNGYDIEIISENVFYEMLQLPVFNPLAGLDDFELDALKTIKSIIINSNEPADLIRFVKAEELRITTFYKSIIIGMVRGKRYIAVWNEYINTVQCELDRDQIKSPPCYRFFLTQGSDLLFFKKYIEIIIQDSRVSYEKDLEYLPNRTISRRLKEYKDSTYDFIETSI